MAKQAERLVQEMNFPSELADLISRSCVSQHLLRLKDSGFMVSESDPLLIIAVDVANPASISYLNNGNYGLPQGVPGGLAWPGGAPPAAEDPLPEGMATKPPVALGKFLAAADGVRELSLGANFVFYVKDTEVLTHLSNRVRSEQQFCRIGPIFAGRLGIPQQDQLVRFFTLDKMSGPPRAYFGFNTIP
jgi:hypothetical protein